MGLAEHGDSAVHELADLGVAGLQIGTKAGTQGAPATDRGRVAWGRSRGLTRHTNTLQRMPRMNAVPNASDVLATAVAWSLRLRVWTCH